MVVAARSRLLKVTEMQGADVRIGNPAAAVGRLLASKLRSSQGRTLILLDRLPEQERMWLLTLKEAEEIFGVLRPSGSGPVKVVDYDLALLLFALREPGGLPAFYSRRLGPVEVGRRVALLVAERILEVEIEGSFLTGKSALAALGLGADTSRTAIAEKSRLAMRYASALASSEEHVLANRLYRFGGLPLTPRWQRQLPGPEEVLLFLGNPAHSAFDRSFPHAEFPWLSWHRRDGKSNSLRLRFKLYISPKIASLPEIFSSLFECLEASRAGSLKVGAAAGGLLRTDKLIVYFRNFEDLAECADVLQRRFRGIPVDGVPFSAQIDEEGLLSWGLDPPAGLYARASSGSWRSRIVHRVAWAILEGRKQAVTDASEWAAIHLSLQGVDVQEWRPRVDLLDIAEA